jgi:hypothetical protein
MVLNLILTTIYFIVLLFISVNLLGFFVRGLYEDNYNNLRTDGTEFVKKEIGKLDSIDTRCNIIGLLSLICFLFILFYFWNIGLVIVSCIMMISRLPDLLWEIKNKKKLTSGEANELPKNVVHYLTTFSWVLEIPLLYYSLFIF